ncbi:hypothetical protein TRVA0_060S00562 [Trichomonascus vanleenenianus]|uniref:PWI domain-containing protein n=1 Tax=Trichomonascus vanleenenianus TaxID=2268995 RepID=UPI003ECA021B
MFRGVPASEQAIERERQKDLAGVKLPKSFDKTVDIAKVNRGVIKVWIAQELERIMPGDEILVDYTIELLEDPNIKSIYLQLKGFLGDKALTFCTKLWDLLLTAQEDPDGIPPELVKLKLEEIKREEELRSSRGARHSRARDDAPKRDHRNNRVRDNRENLDRDRRERRDHRERRRQSHSRSRSRSRSRSPTRRSHRRRSPSRDKFGRDRSERQRYDDRQY